MFPGDLLEPNYADPINANKLVHRSEVERREKYFEQLEREIVKGGQHPLAQLSKDCLNNNPSQRPTAEQLVTALEDMEEEVEGPYGEFSRLDAVRQVATMKALLERDIEVREKANELTARREKIKRLQKKLERAQQV